MTEWSIKEVLRAGSDPHSDEVLDAVAEHFAAICQIWTPDRTSYPALGQLYVDDGPQRERLAAQHPDLPEFARDAIVAYATRRL